MKEILPILHTIGKIFRLFSVLSRVIAYFYTNKVMTMKDNERQLNNISEHKAAFITKIEGLSHRKLNSLVFFHNRYPVYNHNYEYKKIDKENFIKYILRDKNYPEIEKSLKTMEEIFFIEEKYFKWLYRDLRAQFFILKYLRSLFNLEILNKNKIGNKDVTGYLYPPEYGEILVDEHGYVIKCIYELFDSYSIDHIFQDKNKKIKIMDHARLLWSDIYDQCTYTNWIETADDYQIKWLKKYLEDKGCYINGIRGISSTEHFHSVLLAALDFIDIESFGLESRKYKETDSKRKFIDRMKKSWNQKVHRDSGMVKKQYHLPLTKNTKDRLNKISIIEGLSDSAILERLINKEYELKYLNNNGNDRYDVKI